MSHTTIGKPSFHVRVARLLLAVSAAGVQDAGGLTRGIPPQARAADAATNSAPAKQPNVIVVSVDTLNRRALRCYDPTAQQLPGLDEFAAECVRFTHALAPAPWTLPSHASLLTGLYPDRHGATDPRVRISESVATLASQLSSAYETVAFTNGAYLDPGYGLDRGFREYHVVPDVLGPLSPNAPKSAPTSDPVLAKGAEFVASRSSPTRPFFLFLHTYGVHNYCDDPLTRKEAFEDRDISGRNLGYLTGAAPCPASAWKTLKENYDRRVAVIGRDFGAFIEALKRAGLWDNSVVLFTSDHGEAFEPDLGRIHHGANLCADILDIPFLIHCPGIQAREESAHVSLIDVLPTVMSLAAIEAPTGLDGCSLAGLLSNKPAAMSPRTIFAMEHAFLIKDGRRELVSRISRVPLGVAAIRSDRWCILTDPIGLTAKPDSMPEAEIYDMSLDSNQSHPVREKIEDTAFEADVLGRVRERPQTSPRASDQALDGQIKKLGYTE